MPARVSDQQREQERAALLDAAEILLYANGIQAVGMAAVRREAGLPLKRIYELYASKEELVVAVLRRRDQWWRDRLAASVEALPDPRGRVLAIFDWLEEWFREPGFRGCMWINAFGELGSTSDVVLAEVRSHKAAFRDQIEGWTCDLDPELAASVHLLAEGAMVTAAITSDPAAAAAARRAVEGLLPHARS